MIGILIGLLAGAGVMLLAKALWPAPMSLGEATAALYHDPAAPTEENAEQLLRRLNRWGWFRDILARLRSDLAIIEMDEAAFVAKVSAMVVLPPFLGALASVFLMGGAPLLFGLGVAAAMALFFIEWREVRTTAELRRETFVAQFAAFVEFVYLGLSFRKIEGALFAAGKVGDGWAFRAMDSYMDASYRRGRDLWLGLDEMATDYDLPVLGELVASLVVAGEDGAKVRLSLSAKAQSARDRHQAQQLALAKGATTRLTAPIAVFALIALFLFVIVPALLSYNGIG